MKKPILDAQTSETATGKASSTTLLPVGFVILSSTSTQVGAALAKDLFSSLGPMGTVSLRVGWAAIFLLVVWRSSLRKGYGWSAYRKAALLGITLAAMNLSFYSALNLVPLGIAVSLEFIGPLTLAVVQSRRLIDIFPVLLAATGILLLTPLQGHNALPLAGIGLALLAGICWTFYILLTARVGNAFPGGVGLTFATLISAILLLPLGILQAHAALLNPLHLLVDAGVGLLSSALPYSLEMEALRRLSSRIFSILLSLEPAIAALAGLIILHELLGWRELLAMALICLASIIVVFIQKN